MNLEYIKQKTSESSNELTKSIALSYAKRYLLEDNPPTTRDEFMKFIEASVGIDKQTMLWAFDYAKSGGKSLLLKKGNGNKKNKKRKK